MKRSVLFVTVPFTSGLTFAAAFYLARSLNDPGESKKVPSIAGSAKQSSDSGAAATPQGTPSSGSFHDPLLKRALANLDLLAAVKEIMAHSEEDHCADTRLICLVEGLPAERLAELSALLDANAKDDYIVRFVLSTWAKRDPAGAKAWFDSHPSLDRNARHAFLRGWARSSPEAALEWLDAQPSSSSQVELRGVLIETLSEKTPAAALEMMISRDWLARDPLSLLKLLRNWGGSDPQGAIDGLHTVAAAAGISLDTSGNKAVARSSFQTLLSALLNGAYDRNPADAVALIHQLNDTELDAGMEAVAREVLARDPAAAANLISAQNATAAKKLLMAVAAESPGAALRYIGGVQDTDVQRELLLKVASGHHWLDDHTKPVVPVEAQASVTQLLASISNPSDRAKVASALTYGNAMTSPAWSAELWSGMPADQQREIAGVFLKTLSKSDPEVALAAYTSSAPQVQSEALKGLSAGLAASKPEQALQLILQQSEPALKAECAAALFAEWWRDAPDAALAALETNAAQFDLKAIAAQLPQAGSLGGSGRRIFQSMDTGAIEAKIRQLTGARSVSASPP